MSNWIDVGDELPADKQVCICASENVANAYIAKYIGGREFHDFFKNWIKVDYWMPMPAPPEEK